MPNCASGRCIVPRNREHAPLHGPPGMTNQRRRRRSERSVLSITRSEGDSHGTQEASRTPDYHGKIKKATLPGSLMLLSAHQSWWRVPNALPPHFLLHPSATCPSHCSVAISIPLLAFVPRHHLSWRPVGNGWRHATG